MSEIAPSWYVVEAYEKEVGQAYLRLAVAGLKVWAPIDVKRAADRRAPKKPAKGVTQPKRRDWRVFRFGRFFFVNCVMSDALWHAISNQTGVYRVVSPQPVPDEQVRFQIEHVPAPRDISVEYAAGDIVRITKGPLASFPGKVADIDKRGVLLLDVAIFGRSTPVAIEVEDVEMVQQAKPRAAKTFIKSDAVLRAGAAA